MDSRIQVIKDTTSQNRSQVRNKGLSHASGEWIVFMDADIMFKVNILSNLMIQLKSQTNLIAATLKINTKTIQGNFIALNQFLEKNKRLNPISLGTLGRYFPVLDGAFFIVSSKFMKLTNLFPENTFWNEDIALTHDLAQHQGYITAFENISVTEEFYFPQPLYFFYRYFLSGYGTFKYNSSVCKQSRLTLVPSLVFAILNRLVLDIKDSPDASAKSMAFFLRLAQMLGCLLASFSNRLKLKERPLFKAKILIANKLYSYNEKENKWYYQILP